MQSQWFDEFDFPRYAVNSEELEKILLEIKDKWIFEFDTPENRRKMKEEFSEAIKIYERDSKLEHILDNKEMLRSTIELKIISKNGKEDI